MCWPPILVLDFLVRRMRAAHWHAVCIKIIQGICRQGLECPRKKGKSLKGIDNIVIEKFMEAEVFELGLEKWVGFRSVLPNRSGMWATYIISNCLIAILKTKKEAGEINFNYPFYLFKPIKIELDNFTSILYQVFKTQCVFYIYPTSQFGIAIFQMLSSHTWLVTNILDNAVRLTDGNRLCME